MKFTNSGSRHNIKKWLCISMLALVLAFLVNGNAFSVFKAVLKDTVKGGAYQQQIKTVMAEPWTEDIQDDSYLIPEVKDYAQSVTIFFSKPVSSAVVIQLYSVSEDNQELTHLADTTAHPGTSSCHFEIHGYVEKFAVRQASPYSGVTEEIQPIEISEAIINDQYIEPWEYAKIATLDYYRQYNYAQTEKAVKTFVLMLITCILLSVELPKQYPGKLVKVGTLAVCGVMALFFGKQYFRYEGYEAYQTAILLIGILAVLAISLTAYLLFERREKWHRIYACAGFFAGLIFLILLPVYQVPDEPVHLNAAYEISNWILGEPHAEDKEIYMRECDADMRVQTGQFTTEDYEDYYGSVFEKAQDTQVIKTDHEAAQTWHYQYIFGALGITLGRLLGWGSTATFLLGRLLQFLFYLALTTYAVKKIPVGKMALTALALLPMTVQQTMSFSYDGVLISTVFATVALSLHLVYGKPEEITGKDYVILTLCGMACTMAKGHLHFLSAFLPLLILFHKSEREKKEVQKALLVVGICLLTLVISYKTEGIFFPNVDTSPPGYQNYIEWADSEGYTVSQIMRQPKLWVQFAYYTITGYLPYYLETFLGNRLGWLELELPDLCLRTLFFAFVLACIPRKENTMVLPKKTTAILCTLGILECLFVFAGFLVSWTPVTEKAVCGVQGRYFIPTLMPVLVSFRGKWKKISNRIDAPLLLTLLLMLCITAWGVIARG